MCDSIRSTSLSSLSVNEDEEHQTQYPACCCPGADRSLYQLLLRTRASHLPHGHGSFVNDALFNMRRQLLQCLLVQNKCHVLYFLFQVHKQEIAITVEAAVPMTCSAECCLPSLECLNRLSPGQRLRRLVKERPVLLRQSILTHRSNAPVAPSPAPEPRLSDRYST